MRRITLAELPALTRTLTVEDFRLLPGPCLRVEIGPARGPLGVCDVEAEAPEPEMFALALLDLPRHVRTPYLADRLKPGELQSTVEAIASWRLDLTGCLDRLQREGRITPHATRHWWAGKITDYIRSGRLKEVGGTITRGKGLSNFEPLQLTAAEKRRRDYARATLHADIADQNARVAADAKRPHPELVPPA